MNEKKRARKLARTAKKIERLERRLTVARDREEILAIANEAANEAQESLPDADAPTQIGAVLEVLWGAVDVDEDDLNALADLLDDAINVPGVGPRMERQAFRWGVNLVWGAIDAAVSG